MRIIGGRDYYDRALAYGHDVHTVYVRGREEITKAKAESLGIYLPEFPFSLAPGKAAAQKHPGGVHVGEFYYQLSLPVVIACGKRYQGICIRRSSWRTNATDYYFWELNSLNEFLTSNRLILQANACPRPQRVSLEEYFRPTEVSKQTKEALIDHGWTILMYFGWAYECGNIWKVDQPTLRLIEFYRAVPHNIMFQEIDMWLGNLLVNKGKPMIQLSDADRLAKHGMDKTSFRKPKSSK